MNANPPSPQLTRAMLGAACVVVAIVAAAAMAQSKSTPRCPAGSANGSPVGNGSALHAQVTINGTPRENSSLYSDNVVCTNPRGLFHFTLTFVDRASPVGVDCKLKKSGALRIHPQGDVLLRFIFGTSVCGTSGSPPKVFKGPDKLTIRTLDPVFSLTATRKNTLIRVLSGSILVSGRSGSAGAVVLGPNQQTLVRANGNPTPPASFSPNAQATRDLKQVQHEPAPNFSRPDAGTSTTLAQLFQRRSLTVDFDKSAATDNGTEQFVLNYLQFLANSWQIKQTIQNVGSGPALTALANGKIDVVVTPAISFGFDALPLFANASGKTWSLVLKTDPTFKEALRQFLASAVNSRTYSALYVKAFGRPPSYEPLAPVLFPKK